MEGYDLCQKIKNRIEKLVGKLKPSEILEKPWTHLPVDFIISFIILMMTIKRHMTLWSHDISHDMMS